MIKGLNLLKASVNFTQFGYHPMVNFEERNYPVTSAVSVLDVQDVTNPGS